MFHSSGEGKRRGRPVGAKSAVVRDNRHIGLHHFAFLRSCLVGLDMRQSYQRYLEWSESSSDLRHIEHLRTQLLRQILEAARRIDATLPAASKVTHHIELLQAEAPTPQAKTLPSLDEWLEAEGLQDMYSEADALLEYQSAFGLDNPDALEGAAASKDPSAERVKALNILAPLLSVAPSPSDLVQAWFAPSVVRCLRRVGILNVGNLVGFMNIHGYRWYQRIEGFGKVRADKTLGWLLANMDSLQLPISDALDEPKSKRALRRSGLGPLSLGTETSVIPAKRYGLVPIEFLDLPPALLGVNGVYRSQLPNTLEATDDMQAVSRWLSRYEESPLTLRSYKKEIERFVLWCATVQKKPLSSISAIDCQAFRAFLKDIPWNWIAPASVGRNDPQWRPFRGQLVPSSQKQALVIVQTMFEGLRDAGYLVANPMRQVLKSFDLPDSKINTARAFSEAEWQHVLSCLAHEKDAASRLRLRCMLELLVTSGIRIDELAKAQHKDIRLVEVADLPPTWVLTVKGKRNKTREVPIPDDVVALLREHAWDACGRDGEMSERPLLFALNDSVPKWKADGSELLAEPTMTDPMRALSYSGIYAALKRFFGRAALLAPDAGLSYERFMKASTHWMRHTFVTQALSDGAALEVVSELAGHASIDTTSIYSNQEIARKIKDARVLRRRVAGGG